MALMFVCLAAAEARVMAPPPVVARVASSDAVVIGKVESFEAKTVDLPPFVGGQELLAHRIAVVKVDKGFAGAAGLTHVRVAFVQLTGPSRRPQANLTLGEEYVLYLSAVPKQNFFQVSMYFHVVAKKNNPQFAKEAALVERSATLLKDPKAALESNNGEERLLAAAALLYRYRQGSLAATELIQVPVDAEESKRIMLAIAEADWNNPPQELGVVPSQLFYMLGATPADGWTPPKDFKQFPETAKAWLRNNAGKFQIKKLVPAS